MVSKKACLRQSSFECNLYKSSSCLRCLVKTSSIILFKVNLLKEKAASKYRKTDNDLVTIKLSSIDGTGTAAMSKLNFMWVKN